MTIQQLIEALQKFDPNLKVVMNMNEDDPFEIGYVGEPQDGASYYDFWAEPRDEDLAEEYRGFVVLKER